MAKQASTAAAAPKGSSGLTADLVTKATGQTIHYTLPNGELRPAILVRPISADIADIRVFTAGPDDAPFFHGHHGVELVASAKYSLVISPETWCFPVESLMATLWP